jgi:hypothetical protein
MVTKKVIKNIEAVINRVCEDIKDKKIGSNKFFVRRSLLNTTLF